MTQLEAYFDASTRNGSNAFAVAGYIAPVEQWERFKREWQAWLDEFGIQQFHMTDWESRWGEFRDWPDDKRHALYWKLVGTLRLRFHFGVGAAVISSDYTEVRGQFAESDRSLSEYAFCGLQCFDKIGGWAAKNRYTGSIRYVFENGDQHKGQLLDLKDRIRSDKSRMSRYRVGTLVFSDKKGEQPLQAADILAYESWKEMENYILPVDGGQPTQREPRKTIEILLEDQEHRYDLGYYNKASLLAGLCRSRY